jgi:hypothetical protein
MSYFFVHIFGRSKYNSPLRDLFLSREDEKMKLSE